MAEPEPITSQELQTHLAKKRKREEQKKKAVKKSLNRKTVVRPGCKKSKLTREDQLKTENEEERKDLRLLNYPSVEKIVTPLVTAIPDAKQQNKSLLVVDFNRPPYMDPRFRFVGYSMVFLSRHVKHLATSLTMAANVFKETVPIYFDRDGIRIKKCEYDDSARESFIFQVHFHHLLQYYCHVPMGFLLGSAHAQRFAKHHCNQSGECSVIWKYNRDDRISLHILNDDKNLYKKYVIPVIRTSDPLVATPPLQDTELSWHIELEELSRSCDELNLSNIKDASMTFRIWGNALEIFSENETNFHVFGLTPDEKPVRENFQFSFELSMSCLRKVCSRMKKSKGQEKTLTISVDSIPENYVQFSQNLSDQITFQWWLSKRGVRQQS